MRRSSRPTPPRSRGRWGRTRCSNLPLVNRDLYSLLTITGGVTSNDNSNSLGGPEQLTTINGSQKAQIGTVNFQLDGGNNTAGLRGTGNPAPNPEAVQEFRVITNSYAAEYGRYPAGVVDIVTKSGTNQFHGALFGFFRNETLNARRWSPPGVTSAKDPLDRNQYGGAGGGPLKRGQDVLLRQLFRACGRKRPTIATRAIVPTALERPATSRSPRPSRAIRVTNAAVPRRHHPDATLRSGGPRHPGRLRAAGEPAEQLLRGEHARSARTPTRRRSSWITCSRRRIRSH